jgi:hypothetical protein
MVQLIDNKVGNVLLKQKKKQKNRGEGAKFIGFVGYF